MAQFVFAIFLYTRLLLASETAAVSTLAVDDLSTSMHPFSYTLLLDYTSNLYERDNSKYQESTSLWLIPRWSLANKDSLALLTVISKDLQNEERLDINSSHLIYNRKASEFDVFRLGYNARVILPVNEELRDRQGLVAGLAVEILPTLKTAMFNMPKWSVSARTRLTKNFHEFTMATNGRSNIEYSLSQRFDLGYSLTDALSVSTTLRYLISQTYKKNERESFSWSQEVGYRLNSKTSLGVGHANEGGLLRPDGASNVALFDENSSTVYGYLEFSN